MPSKIAVSIQFEVDMDDYGVGQFGPGHPQFETVAGDLIESMIDGEADWPDKEKINVMINGSKSKWAYVPLPDSEELKPLDLVKKKRKEYL